MKNFESRRARYLQDKLSIRLGGLAANLSRIASFSRHAAVQETVSDILLESRWFIEWTALELEITKTAELVKLQVELAVWDLESQQNWQDESWRNQLTGKARVWTQCVLEMSGLLTPRSAASQNRE